MKKISLKATLIFFLVLLIAGAAIFGRYFYMAPPTVRVIATAIGQENAKSFSGDVSVIQNLTTDTLTLLTVLRPNRITHAYRVWNDEKRDLASTIKVTSTEINADYSIDKLEISELAPLQNYYLEVSDGSGRVLDSRQFQSLDLKKTDPAIAVGSCARVGWLGHDFGPRSIWDELQAQSPDVLLFLGDMVYPDTSVQAVLNIKPDLDQIMSKYVEAWHNNRLYHQYNLYPVFAVMDDHDYGFQGANANNNAEMKDTMVKQFRTFYPVPSQAIAPFYEPGPGASFAIEAFGFKLVLLDNKYYRTAAGPLGIDGVIWGPEQLAWLTKILSKDESPALIGSGTLFTFPVKQMDAAQYETPTEFQNFLTAVKKGTSKAVLLSGDVHFSDVVQMPEEFLGYPSYEITASRVHSVSPYMIPPYISGYLRGNKHQLIHTTEKNFVILKPQSPGKLENMEVRIHIKDEPEPLVTTLKF
jgi:alkaline phosphatase D